MRVSACLVFGREEDLPGTVRQRRESYEFRVKTNTWCRLGCALSYRRNRDSAYNRGILAGVPVLIAFGTGRRVAHRRSRSQ
jgi:hypothetical protein